MTINTDILKNTAGLVMWLDGEINSRAGVRDTSINGMQNLVHSPIAGKTNTTGFLEKLNGKASFTDKGITLGGTCFYPSYAVDDLSVELCIDLANFDFMHKFVLHGVSKGGFQVWLGGNLQEATYRNTIVFSAFDSATNQAKSIVAGIDNSKHIYCTITSKLSAKNSSKIYINGELASDFNPVLDNLASSLTNALNVGLGGVASTKTTSVTPTSSSDYTQGAYYGENINWYSFRLWSRQLSPEEIQANYKRDFERFGA